MSDHGQAQPRASGRFTTTASALGFTPPPATLRVKLVPSASHWSLFVQPASTTPLGPLIEWLEPWAPLRVEFGSRRVLRADFDPLPAAWGAHFRALDLDMLTLSPDGEAIATVSGERSSFTAFARELAAGGDHVEVSRIADEPARNRLLTAAQDAALRAAVSAGYYRIPRPLTLHELAQHLDISSSSLSERLRRAEGRVITLFVTEGMRSPWDARTLYDTNQARDALAASGAQEGSS